MVPSPLNFKNVAPNMAFWKRRWRDKNQDGMPPGLRVARDGRGYKSEARGFGTTGNRDYLQIRVRRARCRCAPFWVLFGEALNMSASCSPSLWRPDRSVYVGMINIKSVRADGSAPFWGISHLDERCAEGS